MHPELEQNILETRRQFFGRSLDTIGSTLGLAALSQLSGNSLFASDATQTLARPGILTTPHFRPKVKRVISLFMSGAPSQIDMFDYKPKMQQYFDTELPDSIRRGQRLTTMTSGQTRFPVAPSIFAFDRYGSAGADMSELPLQTRSVSCVRCSPKRSITIRR